MPTRLPLSRTSPHAGPDGGPRARRARAVATACMALAAIAVIAADQATKALVRSSIAVGSERHVLPGLALVHTRNPGIAFGLDVGGGAGLAALIAIALAALALYVRSQGMRRLVWLPAGMIAGGAIGNVIDRVSAGYVTDFIKLPLGWPPFNLADAAITLGVLGLIVLATTGTAAPSQPAGAPAPPAPPGLRPPGQASADGAPPPERAHGRDEATSRAPARAPRARPAAERARGA